MQGILGLDIMEDIDVLVHHIFENFHFEKSYLPSSYK
jgi:hypothetical protein